MAKGYFQPRHSEFQNYQVESRSTSQGQSMSMNMYNRRGLTLPLNQMAIPIYTPPQSREDVEVGGQLLFHNFIHEEFLQEGLSDEVLQVEDPLPDAFGDVSPAAFHRNLYMGSTTASTPDGYSNQQWTQIGSNLREIATQFAASRERPLIRRQADEVDLRGINEESFFQLLSAYFRDGINLENIVALFFFCSDILIRCVRKELSQLGGRLFVWSLRFILDRVCKWVYDNGGWEKVFSNIYKVCFRVGAITALAVIIGCGFVWIRKNW